MADHRVIAVLEAFKTAYEGLPIVGDNVFTGRIEDFENTPSHSLFLGGADVENQNNAFVDQVQLIRDEVTVVGKEHEVDALLMNVHRDAYAAIMADPTLGLDYVQDTMLQSMSEPDYIEDGNRPILSAVFTWRVHYRHSYTDTSA